MGVFFIASFSPLIEMISQSCLSEGARHQFLAMSGSTCRSAVTDMERDVSSVLLASDIAVLAGRMGTEMKIGEIKFIHRKKKNIRMRLTGRLPRHLPGD